MGSNFLTFHSCLVTFESYLKDKQNKQLVGVKGLIVSRSERPNCKSKSIGNSLIDEKEAFLSFSEIRGEILVCLVFST